MTECYAMKKARCSSSKFDVDVDNMYVWQGKMIRVPTWRPQKAAASASFFDRVARNRQATMTVRPQGSTKSVLVGKAKPAIGSTGRFFFLFFTQVASHTRLKREKNVFEHPVYHGKMVVCNTMCVCVFFLETPLTTFRNECFKGSGSPPDCGCHYRRRLGRCSAPSCFCCCARSQKKHGLQRVFSVRNVNF